MSAFGQLTGTIAVDDGQWRYADVTLVQNDWIELAVDWETLVGIHNQTGNDVIYKCQDTDPDTDTTGPILADGQSRIFQGHVPNSSIWFRSNAASPGKINVEKV